MADRDLKNPIDNTSYTNKDFESIYPELLDTVNKLTDKWNPSESNESDPGLVLIKELAILGDKLNYNIDKNVLECFPGSVTQESNARKLYDELGYNMHWYKGAIGPVSFKLKKSMTELGSSNLYTLAKFTQIADSDNKIIYSTLSDEVLNNIDYTEVDCIQGIVKDLYINGSKDITINNLDANLRIYLPENYIAENGIFIKDKSPTSDFSEWQQVDNIISYPAGKKVFEFGVLSQSNTCYIQFPQDVATLLDNPLNIKYTVTKGNNGNIKANTLEKFTNNLDLQLDDKTIAMAENITISQPYSITNGEDIETISEAYDNYKRTIGTFNTLVTKRDYNNFIYDIKDDNKNIISNVITADRTNDINYSDYKIIWSTGGTRKKLIQNDNMTAYDINLYITKPSASIYDELTYDNTYEPYNDENNGITKLQIDEALSEIKSIQHNINLLPADTSLKFNINIDYIVKGLLITYNKVTAAKAEEIENNVANALYKYCNNRVLNYGEELAYDKLIDIIVNADPNIKTFALNSLSYRPGMRYMTGGDLKYFDNIDNDLANELIARMVLNGTVQLFKFDDDFRYEFGQVVDPKTPTDIIESITTGASIDIPTSKPSNSNINENESIQLVAPNLVITKEYNVGLTAECSTNIDADTDIYLGTNTLRITGISGIKKEDMISGDVVIRSSITLPANTKITLNAGDTVIVKEKQQTTLNPGIKYYFLLNNPTNTLTLTGAYKKYILQENEYFIYSSSNDINELLILGSGTQISADSDFTATCPKTDISNNDFSDVEWQIITNNNLLTVTEMKLINLGQGCKVWATNSTYALSNDYSELKDSDILKYQSPNDTSTEEIIKNINQYQKWEMRSNLSINASKYVPQILQPNQSVSFKIKDSGEIIPISSTPDKIKTIMFNNIVNIYGGKDIDAKVLDSSGKFVYALKAYAYEQEEQIDRSGGYITKKLSDINNYELMFNFNLDGHDEEEYAWILPIYSNISSDATVSISAQPKNECKIFKSNAEVLFDKRNSYLVMIPKGTTKIKFSVAGTSQDQDTLSIGYINKLNGYNESEINTDIYDITVNGGKVCDFITAKDTNKTFDWIYKVPADDKVMKPTDVSSFWNKNHLYNAYCIPRIDFNAASYSIKVSPSSIS